MHLGRVHLQKPGRNRARWGMEGRHGNAQVGMMTGSFRAHSGGLGYLPNVLRSGNCQPAHEGGGIAIFVDKDKTPEK